MTKEITVREWVKNFQSGDYDKTDFDTQCRAGWYDWFCRESSLAGKTKKMGKIIARVKDNNEILDNMYVFFKNNCPLADMPLYDQFKFCDIKSGDVIYCVDIDCGFHEYKYVVNGRDNNFATPLFETGSVYELADWFNGLNQ